MSHHAIKIATALLAGLLWVASALAAVPEGIREDAFVDSEFGVLRDAFADREQVKPGEEFTVALRLTPFKNDSFEFHIYGPVMGDEGFPTEVIMDPAPGVTWSDPVYPTPTTEESAIGTMYWMLGQSVILIKGRLADDAQPGPLQLSGNVQFMSCTEEICLSPSKVPITWSLEVVPKDFAAEIAVKPEAELLAQVETDWNRFELPKPAGDAAAAADTDNAAGETAVAGATEGTQSAVGAGGIGDLQGQMKPRKTGKELSIWVALGLALLGGLILNVMPCVLPVVSIKVISLARHAEQEPATLVKQGLVFCAGIIASFLALALVVSIIQGTGQQLGWGFQFQNPAFLIVMATIIFAFGLSLAGVFTIKPPKSLTEAGERLSEKEGYAGSFFKGVLATVLGTPCVGPFLGPALGFAFTRGTLDVFLIFTAVGIGMALPYAALVANPKFLHMGQRERGKLTRSIMDSKGWLVDFERVMAFVLFATVIYLLSILQGNMGGVALLWAIAFLLGVAFALWLWGRLVTMGKRGIAVGILLVPLIMWGSGYYCKSQVEASQTVTNSGSTLAWEPFSKKALEDYLAQGKTVLVDFTADWCPNCKYNEKTALNVFGTKELVKELDIITLKADWTVKDAEITEFLRFLGYSSIPLTAIFPAQTPTEPILLDGVFTPERVQEELRRAAGAKATAGSGQGAPSARSRPVIVAAGFSADELEESEYAVLRDTFADRQQVRPGEKVTLALRLTPYRNDEYEFHIYGHEQGDQGFPTSLLFDDGQAVEFGEPKYPEAEKHEDEVGVGYYLKGQNIILVECTVPKDAQPGKLKLSGKAQFMSCTDDLCLAPSEVPVSWELEVVPADFPGEIRVSTLKELLAPVETDWKRIMLPMHDEEESGPPSATS